MPRDLTAILLPNGQLDEEAILRAVAARATTELFLRRAPLAAVHLLQVEVHDGQSGLPAEDPSLVGELSAGGRAAFVHVNHTAKQAMVHAFVDGKALEGWAGEPGEDFEQELEKAIGTRSEAILDADDGSRLGIGIAASHTVALVRGRVLNVPTGMPTALNLFAFHDRGAGLPAPGETPDEDEDDERLALFAFDGRAVKAMSEAPARELAAHLERAPAGWFGPLENVRAPVNEALLALGERPLAGSEARDPRPFELCALAAALGFAGGDLAWYWDERVLPMLALTGGDPVIDNDELEEIESSDSVVEAMVEVLPYAAPPGGEGALLSSLGDAEVGPLAPFARTGEEYAGAVLVLEPTRLLGLLRAFDGGRLAEAVSKFEHAWYRALRPGQPEGDAFATWRKAKDEEGEADVQRFLTHWTELRALFELAALNGLAIGLLFYA